MKESIGNAFVSGLVIMFLFLIVLILSFAINYSRANKIKNKILNYVANYAELNSTVDTAGNIKPIDINEADVLEEQINRELASVGYRRNYAGANKNTCTKNRSNQAANVETLNPNGDFHYCIYAYETDRGFYYGVETFMYFDIPVIGRTIEIPVYGETRVIYDLGDRGGTPSN